MLNKSNTQRNLQNLMRKGIMKTKKTHMQKLYVRYIDTFYLQFFKRAILRAVNKTALKDAVHL